MKQYIQLTLVVYVSLACATPLFSQSKSKAILFTNGTAHLGTGEIINHSLIGFKDGKINLVANALTTTPNKSDYDTVIDIEGKHIYPGFIVMDVPLGLVEVDAVRSTLDFEETGEFNPNARTLIAYNTDSKIIPTVRFNGILFAQVSPRGGILSGSSSVMKLQAWNWEDAVQKSDDGLHLNWPRSFERRRWWMEEKEEEKPKENKYLANITKIEEFFSEAKAYCEEKSNLVLDSRFEAMRGLFDGTKNLYVHCDFAKEITAAVNFARQYKISKLVIVGGYDSWMLTDMLKENKVSVILRKVHELPLRPEDDIDLPFKLPYLLQKAGVLFCLGSAGDQEATQSRNLPFLAGTTAAYGLTKEEALKAITLNTAKILGLDKYIGSLEVGKDASLFVSTGDALDMRSNKVEMAFIRGEWVDLKNHQYQLYKKYSKKYGIDN